MKITIIEQYAKRADNIQSYLRKNDLEVDIIRPYLGETLPESKNIEALVLSGGPQSIREIDSTPYLKEQVQLIRDVTNENKPVLGICLGHQLLAYSFNGKIRKAINPEIGWYNIILNEEGKKNYLFKGTQDEFKMFQYHFDEVFQLHDGFKVMASAENTAIQAYQISGKNAWGVQFHPEINVETAKDILYERKAALNQHGIDYGQMIAKGYSSKNDAAETIFRNFCELVKAKRQD